MEPIFIELLGYVKQGGPFIGVIFVILWVLEIKSHKETKGDLKLSQKEYIENLKVQGKEAIVVLTETEKTMNLIHAAILNKG